MASIIKFFTKDKFYILTDFKEDALQSVESKLLNLHKDTGTNKFNFYDIEEFVEVDSLKNKPLENDFKIEFLNIKIDSEIHSKQNKRLMSYNVLESFKGLYLNVILTSKVYKIEKTLTEDLLKLEGIDEEISLKGVYYDYQIQ